MNHDRVKLFTEKLDNLTISDYYGLTSPGLTCYLNSVLQETGLKAFFNEDHVQGDDKMFCDQCNEKQDAFIECELAQTPVILTLLLKRFTFDHEGGATSSCTNCKYDLYAIVNHYGNISGGHYTAQIRSFETGEWYCFNDDTVQRVRQPLFGSGNSVRSRTAYLVMYRKESTYSETSHEVDQEAEGRRDEAKTGEALPPPLHQLTDESYGGGENFNLLNGDAFKSSEMFWMKLTDSSTEAEKQLNTKELNRKQLNTNCQKNRLQMEPAWDRTGQDRDPTRDRVKPAGMNGSNSTQPVQRFKQLEDDDELQKQRGDGQTRAVEVIQEQRRQKGKEQQRVYYSKQHKVGKMIEVRVLGVRGETKSIDLCNTEEQFKSMTVRQLKEKIAQWQPDYADWKDLRLFSHGQNLDQDSRLLCEYGVQHKSVIYIILKVRGGGGGPLPPDREDGGMGDKDGRNKNRISSEVLQRQPIIILGPGGERREFQSNTATTVKDLKKKAAWMFNGDVQPTFKGKILDDDNALLTKYGINTKSVIHSVLKVHGGGPLPPDREDGGMGDKDGRNKREKMEVDLCDTEEQFKSVTVLQLKEKIAQRLPDDADVESLRLIFTDKDLDEDSRPLCEYGVQHIDHT
ncbi:hypothetical protein INR49_025500 [Caranx melampygus]|nr:hypothetical protein INR49_025500 [Caranx melampygus]